MCAFVFFYAFLKEAKLYELSVMPKDDKEDAP